MAALHQISVADGEVKSLQEAVRELLENPGTAASRIAVGRTYIQRELTPARHAERCVEVYQR